MLCGIAVLIAGRLRKTPTNNIVAQSLLILIRISPSLSPTAPHSERFPALKQVFDSRRVVKFAALATAGSFRTAANIAALKGGTLTLRRGFGEGALAKGLSPARAAISFGDLCFASDIAQNANDFCYSRPPEVFRSDARSLGSWHEVSRLENAGSWLEHGNTQRVENSLAAEGVVGELRLWLRVLSDNYRIRHNEPVRLRETTVAHCADPFGHILERRTP